MRTTSDELSRPAALRRRALLPLSLAAVLPAWPAAAQQASPSRGGVLTVSIEPEPATFDPIFGNAPGKDRYFYTPIYENLFIQDERGELRPQLAESWTVAADNLSATFRLRDGVTFHDGTPFDAEAVKFNFDRVIDPRLRARARQYVSDLASTEVLDRLTLRVNFERPSGAILAGLANEAGMIVSPAAVRARGADYARNPVGTGAFRFVRWLGGDRIELARHDGYWGTGADGQKLPYLDRIVIRMITNPAVKILELRAGTVQLGDAVSPRDYAQIQQTPAVELFDNPLGVAQYMSFNLTRPPFDDVRLRKAVALGINRHALERVVSRGEGIVTPTFEPPTSWAFDATLQPHGFDQAASRALVREIGRRAPLTISTIQREPDTQIVQILQAQLREVGLEVRVEVMERQAWLDKVLAYNYDMCIQRASTPRVDPDMSFSTYYGRSAGSNFGGHRDEALFDLVERARGSTNQPQRQGLYSEIQRRLLDNYYQTFFFFRPTKDVRNRRVQGITRDFSGSWLLDRVWLASSTSG